MLSSVPGNRNFKSNDSKFYLKYLDLADNKLNDEFSVWTGRFLKTLREDFDCDTILDINIGENGITKGLFELNQQLDANKRIEISRRLPA